MTKPLTYSESIVRNSSVYDNPYQGKDKKVLFVCSAGILRSATAARLYARKFNTRCCGTEDYALIPLSEELLLWADEVVFVNPENYISSTKHYDLDTYKCKIVRLEIPDNYDHMDPVLIEQFRQQYGEFD